ncbi:MAG: hypothetical protein AAFN93_08650 [Bacteroidota bacterium]
MEDKLYESVDELLKNKSFHELTTQERLVIDEYVGGEREYNRLKAIIHEIVGKNEMNISIDVKKSLMLKMKAKHRPVWLSLVGYKMPAYAVVLALFLFGLAFYFFGPKKEVEVLKTITKTTEPIIDTVYLTSTPDTIYVERKIEVKVPVYLSAEVKEDPRLPNEQEVIRPGKSLADQGELRSILDRSE